MKETLSDKIVSGWIRAKRVREFIQNSERRIEEVISMDWNKGMKYILKEIEEIFIEEAGEELTNHSPQTKPNNIGNPSKRINEIGVGCKSRDKTEDVSNIDKEKEVKTNG